MTTFQLVRSKKDKQWRWRAWRNGRIVANSAETDGYKRAGSAKRGVKQLIWDIQTSKYKVEWEKPEDFET